jgi:hypothetical protein
LISYSSLQFAKKHLFESVSGFLQDEQSTVQIAAIKSLMEISDMFDPETVSSFLIPAWQKLCTDNDPKLQETIASYFGKFLFKSKGVR